jgi:hypothetical protein
VKKYISSEKKYRDHFDLQLFAGISSEASTPFEDLERFEG